MKRKLVMAAIIAGAASMNLSPAVSETARTLWPDVASPSLTRLVASKFVFEHYRLLSIDTGQTVLISELSKSIRCPGPGDCYLKMKFEFDTLAAGGNDIGVIPRINGSDGSVYMLGEIGSALIENYTYSAYRRVPPGTHDVGAKVFAGGALQLISYSAEYQMFKP